MKSDQGLISFGKRKVLSLDFVKWFVFISLDKYHPNFYLCRNHSSAFMRKIVFLFIALLALMSCGNQNGRTRKQVYRLTLLETDGFGNELPIKPLEFKESSDSAAYERALFLFEEMVLSNESSLKGDESDKFVYIPTSFELTDAHGRIVKVEGIETDRMRAQREKNEAEAKKAFAGAEFGMSMKEVQSLNYFKYWEKNTNNLHHLGGIDIGEGNYQCDLYFNDDRLYSVVIQSYIYYSASSYNSVIKNDVENLKDVIQSVYGRPTKIFGFPESFKLKKGYTTYAYVWEMGRKRITIGVAEQSSGSKYAMVTIIEDMDVINQLEKEKEASEEASRKKSIEESSALF